MRYIKEAVMKDLQKKMVFMGGPRQCGKTTLAKDIMASFSKLGKDSLYFNWDADEDRRQIIKKTWGDNHKLLIFDELHKFKRWKNWVKGIFDKRSPQQSLLVTGSARLDVYRRGGDSLLGRYHYWRLHPISLSEKPAMMSKREALARLMTLGGFPEPFLDGSPTEARRWRRERYDRVIKDDIRDLEHIRDIQTLSLFVDALRTRVSTPVVLSNIAEDLQVAPQTLKKWLQILERMYLLFTVYPYTHKMPRAIQKPPKVYFFDNGDVIGDEGAIFENLVATSLLKHLHYLEDSSGYRYELRYLRDKEKREVDFVILKENHIESIVEAKLSDTQPSRHLLYYAERLNPPKARQVVLHCKTRIQKAKLEIIPAQDFLF